MTEYFPDIDSALVAMQQSGISEIILMGHSTGGLTASYFESRRHPESIKALILNSPFLDWNQGWKERIIPIVSTLGSIWPEMKISQDGSTAYGESLLKSHRGEWLYNTDWKQMRSPDVNAGWIDKGRDHGPEQSARRKSRYKDSDPPTIFLEKRQRVGMGSGIQSWRCST